MGTTLTGTTPQDTYDSLIKVTDNGPLSGTAKYLSDGLGNDSVLALSTAAVGVGTTSNSYTASGRGNLNIAGSAGAILGFQIGGAAKGYVFHDNTNLQLWNEVAGDLLFGANATERMRITSAGNVGIGTSSPTGKLNVFGAGTTAISISNSTAGSGGAKQLTQLNFLGYQQEGRARIEATDEASTGNGSNLIFYTANTSNALTEVGRWLPTGGLTFNGDTAAANALDDYEEGTWTMGVSFGGGNTGVTYTLNTGTYTKVGRKVTVNGLLTLSNKGSSTGTARVTGLPFTIANGVSYYSAASVVFINISFANQFVAYGTINTTTMELGEVTEAGVYSVITDAEFANNSEVLLSFTYFV